MNKALFGSIGLCIILFGCVKKDEPVYRSVWVNKGSLLSKFYGSSDEELKQAVDACKLVAIDKKNQYLSDNPMQNPNTNSGAIHNFVRSSESRDVREMAFNVCMRDKGMAYEKRCIKNCVSRN